MLNRRSFLLAASGAAVLSRIDIAARAAENPPQAGWRRFELTTQVDLSTESGAAQLWLPLAQSAEGYQRSSAAALETNGVAGKPRDARYGARLVRIDWVEAGPRSAKLVQTVDVLPRRTIAAELSADERAFWLQPTPSVPTDGIVAETAWRIVGDQRDPEPKARALYNWVVENTFREGSTRGCGIGDIKAMLQTGWLGGKCADINTLMTGLSRACGLPARDVYGVRVAPSQESRSLGATGEITKAQHCRSEIYIDGKGWLPVDPADVRKVVLEEKAPLDSDHVRAQRARLFGAWEMNWVGFNSATDIVLPDALRPMRSNFLMYPCALTAGEEIDCLDPGAFRYRIFSRELSA
ncbi:transglutaminase family protein [Rhodoblastus sp.]|uniref:transglutaminase-like domain-containing protein n=1 Tax=Rhodoblastus sp. TaxID=1962975 RepID=UPI0035B4CB19